MPARHPLPPTRMTILLATWIAVVPAFIGCAKKPMMVPFLQKEHREAYAFTEQDLERVQFYSSSDVVVEDLDAKPGGEGMMLVDDARPGVAIGSGPGWIRVRFQESAISLDTFNNPNATPPARGSQVTVRFGREDLLVLEGAEG